MGMFQTVVRTVADHYREKSKVPSQPFYDDLKPKRQGNWLHGYTHLNHLVDHADEEQLEIIEDYLLRMDEEWNLFEQHEEYIDLSKNIMEKKGVEW